MKTLSLGRNGPEVSAICLGSAYFGTRINRETAFDILDTYYRAGGRFIDTANSYAGWMPDAQGGESERTIGAWMNSRKVRDEMFIATKVGFAYHDVPQGTPPDLIRREIEKSLRNLDVERIDLYYAHVDDRTMPLEETLRTLNDLVEAGKAHYLGASNFRAWRMEMAYQIGQREGFAPFIALENHHTYLRPRPEADWSPGVVMGPEHFDFARERGVRLLAYYALLKGAYVRPDRPFWAPYQTEVNRERVTRLERVAVDVGATLNQTVLAWMLHNNPAVLPITTASRKEHLLENLGALDVTISPEQEDFLNFTDLETK
ncbi:MAG: aldo/keto reductase [Chloroflexota bacterium]|nr:aldo/keto reductase [Chloroflexota bacterium]